MKIWEFKTPGNFWATPGLLWDSFIFLFSEIIGFLLVLAKASPELSAADRNI
jgi:hypothetical protein